jgi:hypothetical protein
MTAEQIYKAELERLLALFIDGNWMQLADSIADALADGELVGEA